MVRLRRVARTWFCPPEIVCVRFHCRVHFAHLGELPLPFPLLFLEVYLLLQCVDAEKSGGAGSVRGAVEAPVKVDRVKVGEPGQGLSISHTCLLFDRVSRTETCKSAFRMLKFG